MPRVVAEDRIGPGRELSASGRVINPGHSLDGSTGLLCQRAAQRSPVRTAAYLGPGGGTDHGSFQPICRSAPGSSPARPRSFAPLTRADRAVSQLQAQQHLRDWFQKLLWDRQRSRPTTTAGRNGQRAESPRRLLDVALTVGVAEHKGLVEKGVEALKSPAADHRSLGVRGSGGRADTYLLVVCPTAGTRQPVPARARIPMVHVAGAKGSGRNTAADEGATGNKLKNGSTLVSKFQSRERLATIKISIICVKCNIIRDYCSTYCKY
ncbi:uncharacterized protein LOC113961252 [Neopelma chrysocephalum]|uniref:uncharacterized protein LOC113961252 n=1 Tax=Neopelma chrysocephalum TaxID=114329 RepID=UPI000FCD0D71|nr:uncharacterized protein LOC113961252 [Neopelma chrysocephalum]